MFLAPGSSPEMTYVDTPPTTVPPEASYEEDWEVFDPYVNIAHTFFPSPIARLHLTQLATTPYLDSIFLMQ